MNVGLSASLQVYTALRKIGKLKSAEIWVVDCTQRVPQKRRVQPSSYGLVTAARLLLKHNSVLNNVTFGT